MITELHIENIAVIKKLTVDLKKGFSVLTGETGAGKSIIIDSVNLLLGARSARELIRTGESTASVSACFAEIPKEVSAELEELGVSAEDDGCLYLQRNLSADGKAQARINGRSVPSSLLREVGSRLVNIHGQHDGQQLLSQEKHLSFLDKWAKTEGLLSEYTACYNEMVRLRREIKSLTRSENETQLLSESLSRQINEIDAAKLKAGEEEMLKNKLERLKNVEKITRYSSEISGALTLGRDGPSALEQLIAAKDAFTRLSDTLDEPEKILERLELVICEVRDLSETAAALTDGEVTDPEAELDRLETRLDLIARLEKKYGETVQDVLEHRESAVRELAGIKGADAKIKELKGELSAMLKKATLAADALSERRKACALELSAQITDQLHYLDLEKASFSVAVEPLLGEGGVKRFSVSGCDRVEFMIITNPGEPPKPLSKVASGGELSRVMLALKSVLADSDGVSTIIFDEIDTGVSGKTSQKIGVRLLKLAKSCQVFSITHSAQIAAMGDTHYRISKREVDGRNETEVTMLTGQGRVDELSRIMGGIEITETVRSTAREMIEAANAYR